MPFPTVEEWADLTQKQKGGLGSLFGFGPSPEWKALDEAYKRYAEARKTKGGSGISMKPEFDALKAAWEIYKAKKELNLAKHKSSILSKIYDKSDRNAFGAMEALDQFVKSDPTTVLTEVQEKAAIKYSFERALRLRTTLSGSRITLQDSASWMAFKGTIKALGDFASQTSSYGLAGAKDQANKNFPQVRDWVYTQMGIGGLTAGRVNGTLSQNLRWARQDTEGSRLDSLDSLAAHNSAMDSFRGEVSSTVSQVQAAGISSPMPKTVGNLSSAPSPTAQQTSTMSGLMPAALDQIQNSVAQALNQTKDAVFDQMWRAATAVVGKNVMSQAVSLVPVLNTAVGAAQVVTGIAAAVKAYQDKNKCGLVRRTIVAPGDPDAAFRALEKMLEEDFKSATVAAGQGAAAFAAGFDPTGTASVVTGAATAVYNLINDLVDFGLKYYQAVAANDILSKWKASPFDGDESISYGLSVKEKSLLNDDIKALQAVGGQFCSNFTAAMNECPLLGCFFLTKMPAVDLVEMVASDVALRHEYANVWFDCLLKLQTSKIEELMSKARDVLANSKFKVISDTDAVHDLQVELTTANAARHQKMAESRRAFLDGFNSQHLIKVEEKKRREDESVRLAKVATQSAFLLIKARQQEFDQRMEALLVDVMTPSRDLPLDVLEKRKNAVVEAITKYKAETGGIHKLHTVRNDESNDARYLLRDLVAVGYHRPNLELINDLALYYMTIWGPPRGYEGIRPLRDASRLKKLLNEHYDKVT